jgi:hypothetical protein
MTELSLCTLHPIRIAPLCVPEASISATPGRSSTRAPLPYWFSPLSYRRLTHHPTTPISSYGQRNTSPSSGTSEARPPMNEAASLRPLIDEPDFTTKMAPGYLRPSSPHARRGVERDVISALLGHAIGSVTAMHYVPVTDEEKRAAIARLHYEKADGFPT